MEASKIYLSRPEAAVYVGRQGLRITKGTLAKMATLGGGPEYSVFCGRAYYLPQSLDAWIASRLSAPRRSTSEVR